MAQDYAKLADYDGAVGNETFIIQSSTGADTFSVTVSWETVPAATYDYHFHTDFSDGSTSDYNAGAMRIFGYAGNDVITVSFNDAVEGGRDPMRLGTDVYGGSDSDTIKLVNCTGTRVSPLSDAEIASGAVDGADTFTLIDSPGCFVDGGAKNDTFTIEGDCSGGTLVGSADNDRFTDVSGAKFRDGYVSGGDGDDTVDVMGEWVNAIISGGTGGDTVDCRLALGGVWIDGGDGDDHLFGTSGNDTIDGGLGDDQLEGMAGNDYIIARDHVSFNDLVNGGDGVDRCDADWFGERRIIGCEVVVKG